MQTTENWPGYDWPKHGKVDGHDHVHESSTLMGAKHCGKYLASLLQCEKQPAGGGRDGLHRLTLTQTALALANKVFQVQLTVRHTGI